MILILSRTPWYFLACKCRCDVLRHSLAFYRSLNDFHDFYQVVLIYLLLFTSYMCDKQEPKTSSSIKLMGLSPKFKVFIFRNKWMIYNNSKWANVNSILYLKLQSNTSWKHLTNPSNIILWKCLISANSLIWLYIQEYSVWYPEACMVMPSFKPKCLY